MYFTTSALNLKLSSSTIADELLVNLTINSYPSVVSTINISFSSGLSFSSPASSLHIVTPLTQSCFSIVVFNIVINTFCVSSLVSSLSLSDLLVTLLVFSSSLLFDELFVELKYSNCASAISKFICSKYSAFLCSNYT